MFINFRSTNQLSNHFTTSSSSHRTKQQQHRLKLQAKPPCNNNHNRHHHHHNHHHHHHCGRDFVSAQALAANKMQQPTKSMPFTRKLKSSSQSPTTTTASFSSKSELVKLNNSNKFAFLAIALVTVTILLLACVGEVSTLNCYTCSSADDPTCDEAFTGRANFTDTDCERKIGRPAKVCRKIVQYLENKKIVIRSCGWIDEHVEARAGSSSAGSSANLASGGGEKKPMCYKRSGTFALMMESCICYEDNCNHSASLVPNQSVLFLLASGALLFHYLAAARSWLTS